MRSIRTRRMGAGTPEASQPLAGRLSATTPPEGTSFRGVEPRAVRLEPGGQKLAVRAESSGFVVDVPPLAMHAIVTADFEP